MITVAVPLPAGVSGSALTLAVWAGTQIVLYVLPLQQIGPPSGSGLGNQKSVYAGRVGPSGSRSFQGTATANPLELHWGSIPIVGYVYYVVDIVVNGAESGSESPGDRCQGKQEVNAGYLGASHVAGGAGSLAVVAAPRRLPPGNSPLAEELHGSACAPDARIEARLLVAKGQEVLVSPPLLIRWRARFFTDSGGGVSKPPLAPSGVYSESCSAVRSLHAVHLHARPVSSLQVRRNPL